MYKMKLLSLQLMKCQFLIGAPSSNSGKTTITLGLLRLLKNKGYTVQPFKCGPDYLDPKFHTKAAQQPCINLDTFMMSNAHMKTLFSKYNQQSDVSIVEGVMGLFDGADKMKGSSAEIAMILDLPVILVVNAKAMAYSAAPLIYGFKNFNPHLKVAGVIFNFVNTESHYRFLKDACADTGVEALGFLPQNEFLSIPSRHLGLSISGEYENSIQQAAEHIEKTVDIPRLLEICTAPAKNDVHVPNENTVFTEKKLIIAIAKDEAFNFIYHENINYLQQLGTITYFSPLNDDRLPVADLLYLPGGYPELYLDKLSSNKEMIRSIFSFCKQDGKVIAECGGMMYLGKAIHNKEGKTFTMVDFLNVETSMQKSKLSLGYRSVLLDGKNIPGHEFHYSSLVEDSENKSIAEVVNAKGVKVDTALFRKKNVIASYIHFYWGENANLLQLLFQ